MRLTALFVAMLSTTLVGQEPARPLQINFTASAESFRAATSEYDGIWASEGPRTVAAMERATGLRFEPGPIGVPAEVEHHSIIFLFVYDVWVELWGQSTADEQVAIERKRTGLVDYDGLWRTALELSAGSAPAASSSSSESTASRGAPCTPSV